MQRKLFLEEKGVCHTGYMDMIEKPKVKSRIRI